MAFYLSSSSSFYPTPCHLATVTLCSSFGLIWHISLFSSGWILQNKVHSWRVQVPFVKKIEVFAEVRVVKAVPWGGQFLHRQCSRVAHFDDIFYFGFWCNSSLFFSSVMHRVNSPNATTLNSRCIWEGVLRYSSQGFFPLVSPMYSINSPYWASIVWSSSVSLLFVTAITACHAEIRWFALYID